MCFEILFSRTLLIFVSVIVAFRFFPLFEIFLETGYLGAGMGTRLRRNALRPDGYGGFEGRAQEGNGNEYHPIFCKYPA